MVGNQRGMGVMLMSWDEVNKYEERCPYIFSKEARICANRKFSSAGPWHSLSSINSLLRATILEHANLMRLHDRRGRNACITRGFSYDNFRLYFLKDHLEANLSNHRASRKSAQVLCKMNLPHRFCARLGGLRWRWRFRIYGRPEQKSLCHFYSRRPLLFTRSCESLTFGYCCWFVLCCCQ